VIAESHIREKLIRFLSNDISLDLFEDWLVQQSWNMHKDSNEAALRLASAIELRLAEYSSGHLSECGLRDELRPFVTNYSLSMFFGEVGAVVLPAPPNNVAATAKALQVAFPYPQVSPSPAATEYVDTTRATARG
jgi:hypothetical protein